MNIVQKPFQQPQPVDLVEVAETGRFEPRRHALSLAGAVSLRVLRVLVGAARWTLFLVLYWLRLPVMLISQLISVPALFAWLFSMYAFPEHHTMVVTFGVMSFSAFAMMFLYDSLLMWLSPGQTVRVL